MAASQESVVVPITGICVVSDRSRAPQGYEPILKAFDDNSVSADLWKDGFLSFKSVLRYICICRLYPPGTFVHNIVSDIALVNEKPQVPPGFTALEFTDDTRERSLRKKILCVRSIARDGAIDAVCDVVLLSRQKKPPPGYLLAGDIDGLLLCYKLAPIPTNSAHSALPATGHYPNLNLPYPIHPSGSNISSARQVHNVLVGTGQLQLNGTTAGSHVGCKSVMDGVPFELNPRIKASRTRDHLVQLPSLPKFTETYLESQYGYPFSVESSVLASAS